ncbi:MAG: hypothetical protein K9W44_16415 [Candidatus Lokiarchaeota archaeon]|nr:hypothetical protein [Candidatus Harpocratesius repetitus]
MKEREQLYFFDNKYSFFTQFEKKIDSVIDEKGNIISDLSIIKNIEKNSLPKDWQYYLKFLKSIQAFIELLKRNSDEFYFIPTALFVEMYRMQVILANISRKIKSINIKLSKTNLFGKISQILLLLTEYSTEIRNVLKNSWNIDISDEKSKKDNDSNLFSLSNLKTIYNHPASIWFDFVSVVNPLISLSDKKNSVFLFLNEFQLVQELIHELQNQKELPISWNDFISSSFPEEITTFQYNSLFCEFCLFLVQNHILFIDDNTNSISSKEKKKLQKKIEQKISSYTCQYFQDLCKIHEIGINFENPKELGLKEIRHIINSHLQAKQDEFLKKYEGDLVATSQALQTLTNSIFLIINELEDWISDYKKYFFKGSKSVESIKKQIGQIRGEIARTIEDFDQYTQTLRQNKNQMELEKKIENSIIELESLLRNYQLQTIPFIESNLPDFEKMVQEISQYKEKFLNLQEKMNSTFKEYQDKDVNVFSLMETWTKKFESIINQASFTIRNTLTSIFNKYQSVLQSEQDFFENLSGYTTPDSSSMIQSLDLIQPEKMSEIDLRKQLERIDQKLQKIDEVKSRYLKEREKFSKKLEELLKDSGLESKKCIICHQTVNVAEDHFIKCEFCGSLSHYTCAVWWIEKYNSCPVCHNKYTIPNNDLFDLNEMEK